MFQISFVFFIISLLIFSCIMFHDPRSLWSGNAFFFMMLCLGICMLFLITSYSDWLRTHEIVIGFLVILFLLALLCVAAFPVVLILVFFIEGIKMIRHEGLKPSNLLSLLFSLLLFSYLAIWPIVGSLGRNSIGTWLYLAVSLSLLYVLALLAMYSFSALLNLFHLKKRRKADYIVVLGAGILGTRVTPLLAARIEKGITLLRYNPDAVLLLSGGQGPGEEIAEGDAMAAYAKEHGVEPERILVERESRSTEENLRFSKKLMKKTSPNIIIVTTAYHVFRALLLAKKLHIRCVGFGSKTKWYFTLNALIREFIGYLSLTWKRHVFVIAALVWLTVMVRIW